MKKTIFLSLAALLVILVACNEKKLLGDVEGTWGVKQYLFETKDKTADFNKQKPQFRWIFNADKTFSESYNYFDTTFYTTYDSTFVTDTLGNKVLDDIDTNNLFNLNQKSNLVSGEWVLTNSNKYLQLRDAGSSGVREYKIVSHSKSSLELFRGNEEFKLEAK